MASAVWSWNVGYSSESSWRENGEEVDEGYMNGTGQRKWTRDIWMGQDRGSGRGIYEWDRTEEVDKGYMNELDGAREVEQGKRGKVEWD